MVRAPRCFDEVRSILLVDDDLCLLESVSDALSSIDEVRCCSTLAEAKRSIDDWTPDVVLLDVILGDGDAHELLMHWIDHHLRSTIISVSGVASAVQAFRLGELGVQAYLPKPFSLDDLKRTIDEVLATPPDPGKVARSLIGFGSLQDLEEEIRMALIDEAMARSGGSKRAAAKLLGTSRQVLQYILRKRE